MNDANRTDADQHDTMWLLACSRSWTVMRSCDRSEASLVDVGGLRAPTGLTRYSRGMAEMMKFRAWLVGSEPEVWRRLLLAPRLTLEQLHTVLQHAFGWTNSHMHQFHEQDGTRYARPSPMNREFEAIDRGFGLPPPKVIDERKVTLAEVFPKKGKILAYEYDFGDEWIHAVRFDGMIDPHEVEVPPSTLVAKGKGIVLGKARAAVCTGGARCGPPEDCGGLPGYERILELKKHPPHPTAKKDADDRELLEWLKGYGGREEGWDPEWMDLAEINQGLGRVRVKKALAQ